MCEPKLYFVATPLCGNQGVTWICRLNEYPLFPYVSGTKEAAVEKAKADLQKRLTDLRPKTTLWDDFISRHSLKPLSKEEAEVAKKEGQEIIEV